MPLNIRRFPQAQIDQNAIWLAIAEDSVRAADGVLERINQIVHMLAENPRAGRARDDLGPGLRYFPADSYVVFYTLAPGTLELRRVMHGASDITADLFDE